MYLKPLRPLLLLLVFPFAWSAPGTRQYADQPPANALNADTNAYPTIGVIPLPSGYRRVEAAPGSFAAWLRTLPLKKDRTVYLYNGQPRWDQEVQFAVLDVTVNDPSVPPGHGARMSGDGSGRPRQDALGAPKDLQQCADAVMRLRAEYLYGRGEFTRIDFVSSPGTHYNFAKWLEHRGEGPLRGDLLRRSFGLYMERVFTYCGSLSLSHQLMPEGAAVGKLGIGDVLIHGGSPGHAMLVVDMAVSGATGKKIYLLAQGYSPACDIHVVRNYGSPGLSPWYAADGRPVLTPQYDFEASQFRSWP